MKPLHYLLIPIYFAFTWNSYSQNHDATLIELGLANDSNPEEFMEAASGFYFTAIDPLHGRELWFSDGNAANTQLVKDITPGETDSDLKLLTTLGDLVFFTRISPGWQYNIELWVSNGTHEGTYIVLEKFDSTEMMAFNGKVYFQNPGEDGVELWQSDGTLEGTGIFKDIRQGETGSYPSGFFEFKQSLFFIANDGTTGKELWKSDGTPEGTFLLKDINPTNSAFGTLQILKYNQNFYFMADDGEHGYELFKSDGTKEGTFLIKDINPEGDAASFLLKGAVTDQGILFAATDGQHGYELWKSDGTTNGTFMVKDITENGDSFEQYFFNEKFVALGNEVFFTANNSSKGTDLWKSDGTEEGTQIIMHISDGKYASEIHHLSTADGNLFFLASSDTPQRQWRIWKTDGSESGTFALNDVDLIPNLSSFDFELFSYGGKIFFDANSKFYGNELWVSDGTIDGTKLFKDFNHSWGGMPGNFEDINGLLYFSSRNSNVGNQLFISNGSEEGTKLVKEINSTGYNSFDEDSETISVNGTLFFSANDGIHGFELWKSDGTESGTKMVKDIYEGSKGSMWNETNFTTFYEINDKLYFLADDGVHGRELWVSDGTSDGTKLVWDVLPGASSSLVSNVVWFNNAIYFRAWIGYSTALLKIDETHSKIEKIKDLNDIRNIQVVNNKLLIVAETSGTTYGPHDLWSSDGTAEGTIHLKTFGDKIDSSIQYMTTLKDELYFVAKNPESFFKAIYKTDGTLEGTQLLYDGIIAGTNVDIDILKTCGDYVYFVVEKDNSYSGVELWRTDGSTENTIQITGTTPGEYNFYQNLTCLQNDIYFKDGFNNREIWQASGSTGEVQKIPFTVNGEAPSEDLIINNIVSSGNILYFVGTSQEHGEELYAIRYGELASLPVAEPSEESMDTDIFTVRIANETCAGKNNGSILIESSQEHPFVALLNGEEFNFTQELLIENLQSGDYTVCITIDSNSNFNQCFEFSIAPGGSLEGKMQSIKTTEGTLVNVSIERGTAPFLATLDGKHIASFNSPSFTLLTEANGELEISSGKLCEGKLTYKVQSNNSIKASPNPTRAFMDITLPSNDLKEIQIYIYNNSGQLISSNTYPVKNNVVTIDVQNYGTGIFYAVLKIKNPYTIKFFKK